MKSIKSKWKLFWLILKKNWDYFIIIVSFYYLSIITSIEKWKVIRGTSDPISIIGLVILIISMVVAFYSISRKFHEKYKEYKKVQRKYRKIFNNICHYIHKASNLTANERVSIFILNPLDNEKLLLIGRYSPYRNPKATEVSFNIGEGAAGLAFTMSKIVYENNLPDFQENERNYYKESYIRFNLSEEKVRQLKTKSRCFIAIPIVEGIEGVRGVVLIDSKEPDVDSETYKKLIKIIDENYFLKLIISNLEHSLKKEYN